MFLPAFQLVCTLCQSSAAVLMPPAVGAHAWLQLSLAAPVAQVVSAPNLLPLLRTGSTGSVGTRVALGHARELFINLTPSPARCAPLVALTFP